MLGQTNLEMNFILETVNGVVMILSAFLLVCLTLYLIMQIRRYKLPWNFVLGMAPTAVPATVLAAVVLGAALYVEKTGMLLTRLAVFSWRRFGNGEAGGSMNVTEREVLMAGTILSAVGALWLIRILSKPVLGEWPWIVSTIIGAGYVTIAVAVHLMR